MITKLAIQNFRGLKDVTLNHLRRVNLLAANMGRALRMEIK